MAVLALADLLNRDLSKPGVLEAYTAALEDFTAEQCQTAIATAIEQCRFFPVPAELREYASLDDRKLAVSDPEFLRTRAYFEILDVIRSFGPRLKPKPGKALRTTDNDGRVLLPNEVPREPEILPPALPEASTKTITILGGGNFEAGLDLLAEAAEEGIELWKRREFEKRWERAWGLATVDLSPAERT